MNTIRTPTAILFALACAITVQAQGVVTLDFSGFTLPFYGQTESVPDGYGSLQWSNFYVINPANSFQGPYESGFQHAVSSGNIIWNGNGGPAQISSATPFDFDSAWFTSDWMDGLQIVALGYRDGVLLYDTAFTINTASPTLIPLNYQNIDQVAFSASGGTPNPSYSGYGPEFAIDDLTLNVPEPTNLSLMLTGFAGLGATLVLNKRRKETVRKNSKAGS